MFVPFAKNRIQQNYYMKKTALFLCVAAVAALLYLLPCREVKLDVDGTIAADYAARRHLLGNKKCFTFIDDSLQGMRREAMQFLYAYMPTPDAVDYTPEFYLQNVDYALKAREEMPWGKNVPLREFLHFVLPVRVNNENMDSSRVVFFNELKDRVKNLSMYEAVLEVNHWCHEKVTYTPSDIRTSSPLATVRTAHGRCGEESTFAVAALRAVGIPARQVYTPRWAHTDDNHAWVEAWVDGRWHFIGACEPEPVLDLAWFNAPASRGMLMHTKAFGRYDGPEEVISVTPCYTEINVTANYAPVATTHVLVTDAEGNPLKATVEFKIYNYAEFFTAAAKECDEAGRTSITTGLGDMLAWASYEGKFGFSKFTAGKDSAVTITVDKDYEYSAVIDMDITPPAERNTLPEVTPEQVAENARRFAVEDSIRAAYVATFPTKELAMELAAELGVDKALFATLIEQSRGNHATIVEFLRGCPVEGRENAMRMLFCMSEKDRRDVPLEVLQDHLQAAVEADKDNDVYFRTVVNPRVSNEKLTPFRSFFNSVITAEERDAYKEKPSLWKEWCSRNITVSEEWNPQQLCMSPQGVWETRVTDLHSLKIFFVAGARSMGIPAYINEVTGEVVYKTEWGWSRFDDFGPIIEEDMRLLPGILKFDFTPTKFIDNPKYYSHFTISKIVNGRLQLQNYPEEATLESINNGMECDNHLLVTGTRMADGGVLARLTFITADGNDKVIDYVQRESDERLQVIGNFNSENLFYDTTEQRERSLLSATGRGYYIIALVAPGSEPVNHFMRDVQPYKAEFEKWGQKMVLLFSDKESAGRFVNDFPELPSTVVWGTDIDGRIYNEIVANMKLKNPNRPIILVADTFNRVVFMSQGYSIGLGEQLVKVIKQLSE